MNLEQLNALNQLQTLDLTLLQLKKEAAGIPGRKERLQTRCDAAAAAAEEARANVRAREKEIRDLEGSVADTREKINRYKTQQLQVKTNESYKALEHEIAGGEQEIGALEDRELELMEGLEVLNQQLVSANALLANAQADVKGECAQLDARMEVVRAQFAEVKAKRDPLCAIIDPAILQKYLGHITGKQDAFLVPVHQQSCGGCHMKLTPQILHDVHSCQRWTFCSHCGRLLYDPDGAGVRAV